MSALHQDFKIHTRYNNIDAVFENGLLYLKDDHDSVHSVINIEAPHRLVMENLQMMMSCLVFHPQPKNILLLGVAAGSLLHFLRFHYPESHIDAVDIDGEMIELLSGKGWLPPASQQLSYHAINAFDFLSDSEGNYDLILVDLFIDTFTPARLLQEDVQHQIRCLLSEPGIIACNLLFSDDADYRKILAQWQQLFNEQVLQLLPDDLENRLLLGFRGLFRNHSMGELLRRAQYLSEQHGFDYCATLGALYGSNPVGNGIL